MTMILCLIDRNHSRMLDTCTRLPTKRWAQTIKLVTGKILQPEHQWSFNAICRVNDTSHHRSISAKHQASDESGTDVQGKTASDTSLMRPKQARVYMML